VKNPSGPSFLISGSETKRPPSFTVVLFRMNYSETLSFLYSRLPMFSRIGIDAYKKDLTNITELCEILGNPQHKFKTIHVAGTNGKGSVSHMLAAILQTAGYKTGLYTSPHLRDFRERIRINGEMVAKDFIVDFTEIISPFFNRIEPSFFEISVAMAFEYFAREKVEIAVIEVGLGGRLDSTNIINPEISVITNIGWDHMNILGDTLAQIAFEKAGIIKSNTPIVIGETNPETSIVFRKKAADEKAPIFFADQLRYANNWQFTPHLLHLEIADHHHSDHQLLDLDLNGIYQIKNCITVLEAVHQLQQKGWTIDNEHTKNALRQVKQLTGLRGRWDIIHHDPMVVLDVGHNEDGIKQILNQISISTYKSLHIILGMVKDKDISKVISLLPRNAIYYFTKADMLRALPEQTLAEIAAGQGLQGKTYSDVNHALTEALGQADKEDLVIVCGSVFLVGEVEISKFRE
jgi:dihydrofolate synthase / folylpolyglutamate synthase